MKLFRPHNLHEALRMMAEAPHSLIPVAGGTDLLVSWHHRVHDDLNLIDLSGLDRELRAFELSAESLELGALTTYWDVMNSPSVSEAFPLLRDAARQVGALQIQTRGTWAGNIGNGSPAADGVPVMMAYDATVVLQSIHGRREVPLHDYWSGYKRPVRRVDELIVAVHLPRRQGRVEWFHKVGARSAQTITKVGAALVHDDRGWRVCANSVAPFVCRCRNLESRLNEQIKFSNPDQVRDILRQDIAPIDDLRSTAAYRLNVLARLLYVELSRTQFHMGTVG